MFVGAKSGGYPRLYSIYANISRNDLLYSQGNGLVGVDYQISSRRWCSFKNTQHDPLEEHLCISLSVHALTP